MDQLKEKAPTRVMTLLGEGQVSAMPDLAIIDVGVESTGQSLSQMQELNASQVQNIINALEIFDIEEIKTIEYSINKLYDYVDGQRIDKGYQIRNILEIQTKQMDQVGTIIDTAVSNGANLVQNITFNLVDRDDLQQNALNLAVLNAYDKANSIANAFQYPLNPIPIRITENTTAAGPRPSFAIAREGYTTPIEIGSFSILSSVTVEFTY